MAFEDTLTDSDFERPVVDISDKGIASAHSSEPDLVVDGLSGSLLSRLFAIFLAKGS